MHCRRSGSRSRRRPARAGRFSSWSSRSTRSTYQRSARSGRRSSPSRTSRVVGRPARSSTRPGNCPASGFSRWTSRARSETASISTSTSPTTRPTGAARPHWTPAESWSARSGPARSGYSLTQRATRSAFVPGRIATDAAEAAGNSGARRPLNRVSCPGRQYRMMQKGAAGPRRLPGLLAALALLGLLSACIGNVALPPRHPVPTDGRPNIVFVLTDDLAMNLVPYMPHVQALARAGSSFGNYFVVDSLCCPSRAAIFTGRYPHDDGVYGNHDHERGYDAFNRNGNERRSFGVALQNAGYYTGFMGKYLNEYQLSDPPAPGWNTWDVAGNGYDEYNYDLNENGLIHTYGSGPDDYLTHVLADKAVNFVYGAQYTGKPFALEVATFAPHRPSTPAPIDAHSFPTVAAPRTPAFDTKPTNAPAWLADLRPLSTSDVQSIDDAFRKRVESVQAVDRMVGQIERALAAIHQLGNTYFVFSSDNGYHMGDYGLMPGKQTAFDTDVRVPLVVAGPGVPAGRTVDAMNSSIDPSPTFLQIGQAQPTGEPDGVSLLAMLHGGAPPRSWQQAILIEHHGRVETKSDPDVQSFRSGDPPSYEAVRTPSALYVEYVTGEREYYDLRSDPYELDNRYSALTTANGRRRHPRRAGRPP